MSSENTSFRPLETLDAWREAREQSTTDPVLIFKHSSICPTSGRANEEMHRLAETGDVAVYRVVVQESRDVSDHIAEETGIRHETPQALLLRDGEAVFDVSHHRVKADRLRDQLTAG